ncbi:MAG: hypothetical protein RLP09_35265 [Sandaracinaceae bacterium]|nr:MAG: hypothetical protein EVA89_37355 [Sandaracinaceae bacterium]
MERPTAESILAEMALSSIEDHPLEHACLRVAAEEVMRVLQRWQQAGWWATDGLGFLTLGQPTTRGLSHLRALATGQPVEEEPDCEVLIEIDDDETREPRRTTSGTQLRADVLASLDDDDLEIEVS